MCCTSSSQYNRSILKFVMFQVADSVSRIPTERQEFRRFGADILPKWMNVSNTFGGKDVGLHGAVLQEPIWLVKAAIGIGEKAWLPD